jgi:hypothetical protein
MYCRRTAGKNPFLAPANKACDIVTSALFYGNPDYNRLCYVVEAWRCAAEPAEKIDECLKRQDLLGPYLCREFCDSSSDRLYGRYKRYRRWSHTAFATSFSTPACSSATSSSATCEQHPSCLGSHLQQNE